MGGSLLLYATGAVGWVYLVSALALGGWLFYAAVALQRRPAAAMRFFGWSNVYLATLFLAIAVDVLVR